MLPGVPDRVDLPLDTPPAESRADDDAIDTRQSIRREGFTVDKADFHLPSDMDPGDVEALPDALVGVLEIVFAHETYRDTVRQGLLLPDEVLPDGERLDVFRLLLQAELFQDAGVQPLPVHVQRHFVDAGQVFALDHAVLGHVAEGGDLVQKSPLQMLFRPQDQDVRLDAHPLQFLDGMLGRLGLQFPGRPEVGDVGQVDAQGPSGEFPAELPDRLHERSALDVADGAADLGDDEVELPLGCIGHDPALDFVGDVRDHLDRLPEIISPTLLVDDRLVDLPGRHRVPPGGPDAGEALVVPEVQVRLHPVLRDIALSVLIRI